MYLDESGGSPEDAFGSGDIRRRLECGGDLDEDRLDPELDLERRRRQFVDEVMPAAIAAFNLATFGFTSTGSCLMF